MVCVLAAGEMLYLWMKKSVVGETLGAQAGLHALGVANNMEKQQNVNIFLKIPGPV